MRSDFISIRELVKLRAAHFCVSEPLLNQVDRQSDRYIPSFLQPLAPMIEDWEALNGSLLRNCVKAMLQEGLAAGEVDAFLTNVGGSVHCFDTQDTGWEKISGSAGPECSAILVKLAQNADALAHAVWAGKVRPSVPLPDPRWQLSAAETKRLDQVGFLRSELERFGVPAESPLAVAPPGDDGSRDHKATMRPLRIATQGTCEGHQEHSDDSCSLISPPEEEAQGVACTPQLKAAEKSQPSSAEAAVAGKKDNPTIQSAGPSSEENSAARSSSSSPGEAVLTVGTAIIEEPVLPAQNSRALWSTQISPRNSITARLLQLLIVAERQNPHLSATKLEDRPAIRLAFEKELLLSECPEIQGIRVGKSHEQILRRVFKHRRGERKTKRIEEAASQGRRRKKKTNAA